ncbi:ABC transporter ATP-binding protein [Halobellus limi]|uniref:ABC-type multidrug transport system, ATPase component n=1 Tax=Halobellus limi TaxID=699433 RepID=A0A1H5SX35_9EURY|nr:ABC transporter ATP-binding protein [Halobellus limi]SEF55079.1 ABC-type multidrug transport system, ATPase component [Halobellus limi]
MSGDAPATALRARAIEQSFGDVDVLSGVSLSVERGEVAAIVGPNGSGKSTLLRILAGIAAPDGGSVTVPRAAGGARSVGYLPQRPAFREGFTARDTLGFYAQLLDGVDDEDVAATLDRVGLSGVADRSVGSLSGGMTRLLGLGESVLGDPSVLILDEPGSGLDPAMVERLFGVLGDLAADGTAVVVASHELPAVEAHADTVHVLDEGDFGASGSPAALLAETDTGSLSAAFLQIVRAEVGEATVRSGVGSRPSESESDDERADGAAETGAESREVAADE